METYIYETIYFVLGCQGMKWKEENLDKLCREVAGKKYNVVCNLLVKRNMNVVMYTKQSVWEDRKFFGKCAKCNRIYCYFVKLCSHFSGITNKQCTASRKLKIKQSYFFNQDTMAVEELPNPKVNL